MSEYVEGDRMLRFGFGQHEQGKSEDREKKFKALSDEDKMFYHNMLCWVLMGTAIDHVSKDTIPSIVARAKLGGMLTPEKEKNMTAEYLERFIGYETNVETRTDREFLKRFERTDFAKSKLKTVKQVDDEYDRYVLEVYGIDLKKED